MDVRDLCPDQTDEEIVEELADFFGSISKEFIPLQMDSLPISQLSKPFPILHPHEVSSCLKNCRKPKSMVAGDIFPCLVTALHDILAIPLTKIYNNVLQLNDWPDKWKTKTVTVIPKGISPQTFNDCHNLSCKPLFTKVLESIVLERVQEELRVDLKQYGGIKKCGTEHLLVEAWDKINERPGEQQLQHQLVIHRLFEGVQQDATPGMPQCVKEKTSIPRNYQHYRLILERSGDEN